MHSARLIVDRDFVFSDIDPRIHGGFAEHLGRHVYGGMFEPGHPTADAAGFREDVLELFRELGMPIVRYPGGNFVSGHRWEDAIGPVEARPCRLDLAWGVRESNRFGTDEFVRWCRKAGTEPMLAVNLGTRGVEAARALVEYCNHPSGTRWSDLRRLNGSDAPHRIRTWCLGNEMDGDWQIGTKGAREYGVLARETSKAMKAVDPGIETILCGSSGRGMESFGRWEWDALAECYDVVDYVSLHTYHDDHGGDLAAYFAESETMGDFIEEAVALCDAAMVAGKHRRRMMLSFDEWNVWFPENNLIDRSPTWPEVSTRRSDVYDMADVLGVGMMHLTLLEHADRVRIGCIAQIVNVLAPILTVTGGAAWRQTIHPVFALTSRYGRGRVLRSRLDAPRFDAPNRDGVPVLKVVVVESPESDELRVFAVNRDPAGGSVSLELDLRGWGTVRPAAQVRLRNDDLSAVNSAECPDRVVAESVPIDATLGVPLRLELAPWSWNLVRFATNPAACRA